MVYFYTSISLSVLFILQKNAFGWVCEENVCSRLTDEEPCVSHCHRKQVCECCFELDPFQEKLSTHSWYTNQRRINNDRHGWFRYRKPFKPIAGNAEETMIAGVLYTHSQEVLKMTVLFPPLYPGESRNANVYVTGLTTGKTWGKPCHIKEGSWHCLIRFNKVPHSEEYEYEVDYTADTNRDQPRAFYTYGGMIPQQKEYPRIAAVGCFGPDSRKNKDDLRNAIIEQEPDILVLQGDQTYFHSDLLYGFLETVYTLNDLTRNIPTIVQMDDHDYGQGDIWGAGEGEDDSGSGFEVSPCVVNAAQALALSHLPDPGTDKTLDNGISIHYTNYIYGNTDLAILESRKFMHRNVKGGDSLFGSDQEAWVEEWCANQDRLKVVLLQTPIMHVNTNRTIDGRIRATPQFADPTRAGRDRFLDITKNCTQLFVSGDQHLGIVVTYEKYGISECASPAAINDVYWRLNLNEKGRSHVSIDDMRYTLHNVWNVKPNVYEKFYTAGKTRFSIDAVKQNRADGFLMVDLDGATATCEMHGYRVQPKKVWEVTLPAQAPIR